MSQTSKIKVMDIHHFNKEQEDSPKDFNHFVPEDSMPYNEHEFMGQYPGESFQEINELTENQNLNLLNTQDYGNAENNSFQDYSNKNFNDNRTHVHSAHPKDGGDSFSGTP